MIKNSEVKEGKISGYKIFVFENDCLFDIVNLNHICESNKATNLDINSEISFDELKYGNKGFHFCHNIKDCFNYISNVQDKEIIVCEVECELQNAKPNDYEIDMVDGFVCNKYKIKKVLSQTDLFNFITKLPSQEALLFISLCKIILKRNLLLKLVKNFDKKTKTFYESYFKTPMMQKILHSMKDKNYTLSKGYSTFLAQINELLGFFSSKCVCQYYATNSNKLGELIITNLFSSKFKEYVPLIIKHMLQEIENKKSLCDDILNSNELTF